MGKIIEELRKQILKMEQKSKVEDLDKSDKHKLRPIDIKDIEQPEKYDGTLTKFEGCESRHDPAGAAAPAAALTVRILGQLARRTRPTALAAAILRS